MNSNDNNPTSSRAAMLSMAASVGLLLIAAAIVIPIASGGFPQSPLYKILFTAGALVCLVAALFNKAPKSLPMRERRWHRIEGWSAIFFCTAAFFMWYPGASSRDWLAFTLAGATIRIIVFFRGIRASKKA